MESLWRYPVKSMRGEELDELFVSYAGVYGDRLFAFHSTGAHKGFPFLTGREQRHMIRYRPRFRYPEKAARPINLDEAVKLSPLVNPVSATADDLMVEVETPEGNILPIDSPRLDRSSSSGHRGQAPTQVASLGQSHYRLQPVVDHLSADGRDTVAKKQV